MYKKDIKVNLDRNKKSLINKKSLFLFLIILISITAGIVVFKKMQIQKEPTTVVNSIVPVKLDTIIKSNVPSEKESANEIYKIKRNDNLWKVAKRIYGVSINWVLIYDANRGSINDPDFIKINQILNIPKLTDQSGVKIKEIILELTERGYFDKVLKRKLKVGNLDIIKFEDKQILADNNKEDSIRDIRFVKRLDDTNENFLKKELIKSDSLVSNFCKVQDKEKIDTLKNDLKIDTIIVKEEKLTKVYKYNSNALYNKYRYSKNQQ